MFRKSTGNMYEFVDYTLNIIKGKCPHNCEYCYMKKFPQGKLRFDESVMKTNLGNNNFIFVGSSCDMFANDIPEQWIIKVLNFCSKFDNKYLFQTKNLERLFELKNYLPSKVVIGTTIETNKTYSQMGNTVSPIDRSIWLRNFYNYETMITIEPIMDFDLEEFIKLIKISNPKWINIGADSKQHNLPEPQKEKILLLIEELNKITEIKKKSNLYRLIK